LLRNKSYHYYLTITIAISIAVYSIIIYFLPSFNTDDYEIFGEISKKDSPFFNVDLLQHYFLNSRPLSYLFFKLYYTLWGLNSVGMKMSGLLIHLGLMVVFFRLIVNISRFMKINPNYKIALFITLIFSLFPDNSIWIYEINNQTELLLIFFYLLAISFYLQYLMEERQKEAYLFFYILCYFLSILSKQQSLHLPVLMLFITYFVKNNLERERYNHALLTNFVGIAILIVISLLNYSLLNYHLSLIDLLKKPVAALGILINSFIPVFTEHLYYSILFSDNNLWYIILSILLVCIILFAFIKKYGLKNVSLFLAGYIIILYPRIYTGFSRRINTIIIFWCLLLIFIAFQKFSSGRIKNWFMTIYTTIILLGSSINFIYSHQKFEKSMQQTASLNKFIELNKEIDTFYIACSFMQYLNPYELYFYTNNSFGKDTRIKALPITCFQISPIMNSNSNKQIIFVKQVEKKIVVDVPSFNYVLDQDKFNEMHGHFYLSLKLKKPRGYSRIEITIPDNSFTQNYSVIYYTGAMWKLVDYLESAE